MKVVIERLKTELQSAENGRDARIRTIKTYEDHIGSERKTLALDEALIKELTAAITALQKASAT